MAIWHNSKDFEFSYMTRLIDRNKGVIFFCKRTHNGESIANPWVISSVISNILVLSKTFATYCFCWVRREANEVAH